MDSEQLIFFLSETTETLLLEEDATIEHRALSARLRFQMASNSIISGKILFYNSSSCVFSLFQNSSGYSFSFSCL